eukprot:1570679-Prymnesium_polylepis.1
MGSRSRAATSKIVAHCTLDGRLDGPCIRVRPVPWYAVSPGRRMRNTTAAKNTMYCRGGSSQDPRSAVYPRVLRNVR